MCFSSLFGRSLSSLMSALALLAVGVAMLFGSFRDCRKLRYNTREVAVYSKPVNAVIAATDSYTAGKVADLSLYRSVYRRTRCVQLKVVV